MINANAWKHPRTEWEILAACWRATEYGAAIACTAAGKEIVSIVHDRSQVPAFSFWRGCEDVTGEFLKVLRARA
jgi:hypothetical protein